MTSLLSFRERPILTVSLAKSQPKQRAPASRWVVPLLLGILAVASAMLSTGFLEADELTHFLNSKKTWVDWRALLSIWGRMGCTGLYALAAPWGFTAARLLAVAITLLVGLGTALLLRHFVGTEDGRHSWTARHAVAHSWLLLFAQPMFALNSFTVMTEMLLACTWVWAAVILVKYRGRKGGGVVLAGLVLGLGGLMRPEGWLAVACWPIFVWAWLATGFDVGRPSRWSRLGLTFLSSYLAAAPALIWYMLGVAGFGQWSWVTEHWPWAAESPYGKTGAHFIFSSVVSMGGWMWPLIAVGALQVIRQTREGAGEPRRADGLLLLVCPMLGVFAVHGVLGSLGLFGSMSLPRYFLCIAPMASILAVMGAIAGEARVRRSQRRGWRRRGLRALVVGMPVVTLLALIATGFLPMWEMVSTRRMRLAADEIRRRVEPASYEERLILGHPYLIHLLGMNLGTQADRRVFSAQLMANAPAGTILAIHQNLWTKEGRWGDEQLKAWGYREDDAFAAKADALEEWHPITMEGGELARVRLWIKE